MRAPKSFARTSGRARALYCRSQFMTKSKSFSERHHRLVISIVHYNLPLTLIQKRLTLCALVITGLLCLTTCSLCLAFAQASETKPIPSLPNLTTEKVLEFETSEETRSVLAGSQTFGNFLDTYLYSRRRGLTSDGGKSRKPTGRKAPLSPVILVPGYGGSRLEAKINKQQVKHYFCERQTDWTNIWIDLKLMLPYMIDCLIEDFRLEFDSRLNTTHNTQGVEIRVRNPVQLETVEYLTDIHLASFGYFAAIIKRLTQAFNYKRNVNIRGAPYDFRKSPNELATYFNELRVMVEKMFLQANKQKVTFVCHSMGCNNVLYFLQRQTQKWKDKHIRRIISLAAPWGGSMQAVRATAFGDNLGLPYLFDEAELKIVQQSVPSTMYLYPNERAFGSMPLIRTHVNPETNEIDADTETNKKSDNATTTTTTTGSVRQQAENYTAHNFKPFFERINHTDGYLMWLNTKDLLRSLEAPGVEVNCLYGKGHSTLNRMDFDGEFPNSQENNFYGDGDGTVSLQSSLYCREWSKEQAKPVNARAFYANHVEMMKDPDVLSAIEEILKQDVNSAG